MERGAGNNFMPMLAIGDICTHTANQVCYIDNHIAFLLRLSPSPTLLVIYSRVLQLIDKRPMES